LRKLPQFYFNIGTLKDAEFKKLFDVFLIFFSKINTVPFMNFVRYFIISLHIGVSQSWREESIVNAPRITDYGSAV
jgi:hypothetical protein